jgi:hypothetical protein
MRYALFIDWENLWHEHLGRCFPGFSCPASFKKRAKYGHQLPNFPESKSLSDAQLSLLGQLPATVVRACNEIFGSQPEIAVATAIWSVLPFADETNIKQSLRDQGIVTTAPSIDADRTPIHDLSNASDFRLALDLLSNLFLENPTPLSKGRKPTFRTHLPVDAVVIVSGDFIFGQLVDHLRRIVGLDVHILTSSYSIAGQLEKKMSPNHQGRLHYLDVCKPYQDLRHASLGLDELHQYKTKNPTTFETLLIMAAIKRLNDRSRHGYREPEAETADFMSWIAQWSAYWQTVGGRTVELHPKDAVELLLKEKIVELIDDRKSSRVRLRDRKDGDFISTAIALDAIRRFAFEHLEPPRVCRRLVDLSQAASLAGSSRAA